MAAWALPRRASRRGSFLDARRGEPAPELSTAPVANSPTTGRYAAHFELKTILVKIVALNTAVWSGLALGREGPAVYIGAAFGWNASRFVRPRLVDMADQRHAKRLDDAGEGGLTHTLVAAGAAGGFAAVFNAPLGGILYIFEEIAGPTGWSARATRGSVMCTMFAMLAVKGCFALATQTSLDNFHSIIVGMAQVNAPRWRAAAW